MAANSPTKKEAALENCGGLSPIQFNINEISKTVLDQAQAGVWISSLDGITTYVNKSMSFMLGYSVEEFLGQNSFKFMDQRGKKIAERNLEKRRQGISGNHEFCLKHKNGCDVWVVVAANPLRDASGVNVGVMGFITEIDWPTGDKKMQAVSRSEKVKKEIFKCGNLRLDIQAFGVQLSGRTLELSAFHFKLLRYFVQNVNRVIPREEILERVWEEAPPSDRVIDAHIVSLRKKLKAFRGQIKTVYGIGYILKSGEASI